MKKFVDALIELKDANRRIKRANTKIKDRWGHESTISPTIFTISRNDLLKYDFTRTDIERMLRSRIFRISNIGRKATLKLILEGKLDFYMVGAEGCSEDDTYFTTNELKKIIKCEHFYRTAKAGMQCEPVALLNARTMVIYQHNITSKIILEILERVDITKTLKYRKKKFLELARRERNSEFELFLECMEGK